jgi:hypothetical protein
MIGRSNCQLHGALHQFPLVYRDILADGFRCPLHAFGRHLQIGKQLHLLAAVVERPLLSYHRLHAAHSRGELCIFDVQLDVDGKLPSMAVRTQVVGT